MVKMKYEYLLSTADIFFLFQMSTIVNRTHVWMGARAKTALGRIIVAVRQDSQVISAKKVRM